MILVVGATGLLGTRVCERLRAEGQAVRALVRRTSNPDKVKLLKSLGCELLVVAVVGVGVLAVVVGVEVEHADRIMISVAAKAAKDITRLYFVLVTGMFGVNIHVSTF